MGEKAEKQQKQPAMTDFSGEGRDNICCVSICCKASFLRCSFLRFLWWLRRGLVPDDHCRSQSFLKARALGPHLLENGTTPPVYLLSTSCLYWPLRGYPCFVLPQEYVLEEDKRATTNVQNRFALFFLLSFLLFCSPWAKTLCFEGLVLGANYEKVRKIMKKCENYETILPFSCCPLVFLWMSLDVGVCSLLARALSVLHRVPITQPNRNQIKPIVARCSPQRPFGLRVLSSTEDSKEKKADTPQTWWAFQPWKKIFSPPPPPIPQFAADTLPAPWPLLETPPSWDFQEKQDAPLPSPAPRTPPSPSPEQKKLKISETSTEQNFST